MIYLDMWVLRLMASMRIALLLILIACNQIAFAVKPSIIGTWLVRTVSDSGIRYDQYFSFSEDGRFQLVVIEKKEDGENVYTMIGNWDLRDQELLYEVTCSDHPRIRAGDIEKNTILSLGENQVITRGRSGRIAYAVRAKDAAPEFGTCRSING
ncbi:MAG: hypothetical protein R3337_02275 [Gammaproteobacteria bacterium]|nr:hypothetical protein [Gammaproteobacteria bacterium]